MAELEYDDVEARLNSDLHDGPPKIHERLRAWAADERRVMLLPPRLRHHAERLLPKARRPRLPTVFLAAVVAEWTEAGEPRGKTLAERYKRYIVKEATIRGWLKKARDRGLYDYDGDRPTDDALRLLARDPRTREEIIASWLQRGL